jgi:hypothetical protein
MTVASAAVSACLVVVEGCKEGVKLRLRFKALSLAGFVELTTECVGHEERITQALRLVNNKMTSRVNYFLWQRMEATS